MSMRLPLILAASLALLPAGCGGSSTPKTTASKQPPIHDLATAVDKFAACMRAHGVPGYPDPVVSSSGNHVSIKIGPGNVTPGAPALTSATQACHSLLPDNGGVQQLSPQQFEARLNDLVSFAQCMHRHGIANFPDPTVKGELSTEMVQQAGVDLSARSVQTTAFACAPASHGVLTRAIIAQALRRAGA
jgi:hypothetical protein